MMRMRSLPRLGMALGCGVLAAIVAFVLLRREREAVALVGWASFCAAWLGVTWREIEQDKEECSHDTVMRRDEGRFASGTILVVGSLGSLVGVAFALNRAGSLAATAPSWRIGLTGLAFLTVLLTWLSIQTLYTLHYAHLYYEEPVGGIAFEGDETPTYTEFAYLAFTIGMTYQVSDTPVSKRAIRRVLLHHALLSYLFATVLVALTVGSVAGLIAGG